MGAANVVLNVVPYLVLAFGGYGVARLFRRTFGEALPVFCMAVIAVLYVGGFLSNLLIGVGAAILMATAGLVWFLFSLLHEGEVFRFSRLNPRVDPNPWRAALKPFNTSGFFAFTALFVFIVLINFRQQFTWWDDFSHWGVMLKSMLRMDQFYNVEPMYVHANYPPAIQLFLYFWGRLTGGFAEANAFRALQVLSISFFVPRFAGYHAVELV